MGRLLLKMTAMTSSPLPLIAPDVLSPSSISTFRQCPLKFKFSKIDGLQDSPTQATMLGNFVHEVLEQLYALEPEARTQSTAKELARVLWRDKWEEQVSTLIHNDRDIKTFRWSAWWCIENVWLIEDPQSIVPWAIETHVEGEVGGVKLHGYIDRLMVYDGGAKVSDYKTGKTPKPAYVEDKFFQLIIYTQLLSSLGLPVDGAEVELLYLKDGVRFHKAVSNSDVKNVASVVSEVRGGIESRCKSGEFEPKTSILCNWCGFKKICPAWK